MTPRTIGPYTVIRELGRGGMGVVFEVRHNQLEGTRALKLISAEADDESLARFGREAELLARIQHPGVVRVHELGRAPEGPYLVMELLEGASLKAYCRAGPMEPKQAATLVRDVADSVQALHAHGILHRDLKPENVILTPEHRTVLLDFGIARSMDVERLTQTGQLMGSPAYMAPEQADGMSPTALDARTDVYGLGAVLFHLLAGRFPFESDSMVSLLKKILVDDPEWPECPPDLGAVLRKAMAKERAHRYATATALQEDLQRYLDGASVQAPPIHPRRSLLWPALALLLLIGGVATAYVATRQAPAEPEPVAGPPPEVNGSPTTPVPVKRPGLITLKHPEGRPRVVWGRFLDDDRLITAGYDPRDREANQICLWDLRTSPPSVLLRWPAPGFVGELRVTPARDAVIAAVGESLVRLDLDGTQTRMLGPIGSRIRAFAFAPDEQRLVIGTYRPTPLRPNSRERDGGLVNLVAFGPKGPTRTPLLGPDSPIFDLDWRAGPPEVVVAATGTGGEARAANAETGVYLWRLPDPHYAARAGVAVEYRFARFSPDGRILVGDTTHLLAAYAPEEFQDGFGPRPTWLEDPHQKPDTRGRVGAHNEDLQAIVFLDGGERAISISGREAEKTGGELREWDMQTHTVRRAYTGWPSELMEIDLSPDGKQVVLSRADQQVEVWTLEALLSDPVDSSVVYQYRTLRKRDQDLR